MSGDESYIERLEGAFDRVPRRAFLPPEVQAYADDDRPLPIRHGQTNSQPSLVRTMLRSLQVQPGDKVLDVGSGSGWTSALLGALVGKAGKVVAVERIPQLLTTGRDNCGKVGINNISFYQSSDDIGWPDQAPYERILVSASATRMSKNLLGQLAPDGRLVIPVLGTIEIWSKDKAGRPNQEDLILGTTFVPLIRDRIP